MRSQSRWAQTRDEREAEQRDRKRRSQRRGRQAEKAVVARAHPREADVMHMARQQRWFDV